MLNSQKLKANNNNLQAKYIKEKKTEEITPRLSRGSKMSDLPSSQGEATHCHSCPIGVEGGPCEPVDAGLAGGGLRV